MDIQGIQSGVFGMALFDAWYAAIKKSHQADRGYAPGHRGSPMLAAANNAFESYVDAVEMQNAAQIAALAPQALTPTGPGAEIAQSLGADLSTYSLSPAGMPKLINASQMAPFLALNIMA